jgi:rhodanese-related sulfurtransferase
MIMAKQITRIELQARIAVNPGVVLLEALPEKYFNDWHLPGARHFPHDQVKQLAAEVVPNKDAEIVVYCASATCQNSHIAANQLTALGYANVAVYAGGKKDWSEAGLPIERPQSTLAA